jgi:hypothetical protein
MARIDPHLTFGCEVALDVTQAHVSKLEDIQHEYLCRLLGLNRRSVLSYFPRLVSFLCATGDYLSLSAI